jgi:dienelactone hydrolase
VARNLRELGVYSDLVAVAKRANGLWPRPAPGERTRRAFLEALGFNPGAARPKQVKVERRWERDGVAGEAVSWSCGYGPRTQAWVLKPAGAKGRLPGVVALHDHGGVKYYGKEKIADGEEPVSDYLQRFRDDCYGGRAFANELARQGFVVLAHDVFLWGSRRFADELMAPYQPEAMAITAAGHPYQAPPEIGLFNAAARLHEHVVEKYCHTLGTTLAGIVNHEDCIAVNYLMGRGDVAAGGVGCVGLSGGGMRSVVLQATTPQIRAAVVVAAMCTYEGLLDHNIRTHTWLIFPAGWARIGDWPDAAACRAPSPLMVQYDLEDGLYTVKGMKDADRRIRGHYRSKGRPASYEGRFYPGRHKFDAEMQGDACGFFRKWLGGKRG